MKFISVALVGALLLVSLAVPLASNVSASEGSTLAVLFDFGNGRIEWADVAADASMSALNATEHAAEQLGFDLVAPGGFVSSIGGVANDPNWVNESWSLWLWNSTTNQWDVAMEGAATIGATEHSAIAWSYVQLNEFWMAPYAPAATPDHRYPWTSFRHDNSNTGYGHDLNTSNPALLWSDDLGNGAIDSSIVGAKGMIFVKTGGKLNATTWAYDTNSTVFALNSTGVVWSADVGKGYQVGSPLLVGDVLIVPSADGKVYAFNAKNGTKVWEPFETHSGSTIGITSSPIVYRNNIIFADGKGVLYSLNLEGEQNWNLSIASSVYSSSPAASDGMIYIGAEDGKVHAVAVDGTEMWSTAVGGKVRGSPILADDMIVVSYVNYTGTSPIGGGLAALSFSGEVLWQLTTGVSPASAVLTKVGFAVTTNDGLTMVDFDGKKLWNVSLGTTFAGGAPTYVNGTIFLVTNEAASRIVAINEDGSIVWQQALAPSEYALSSPTVINNLLYVASDNGNIYAFQLNAPQPNTPGENPQLPLLAIGIVVIVIVAALAGVFLIRRRKK